VRLTVVGSGTSQPQPETPASGLLVETETTALLVDCGQGIVRELMGIRDPRELDGIVIGHMHADHYIDLVSLRYLLPWEGVAGAHLPVLVPPGGKARLDALATAVSERPRFFDDAYSILEYDPAHRIHVGDLTIAFVPGQHYVPAWGFVISDTTGARIAISGDTGPNAWFGAAAHGADLAIVEATLKDAAFDDPRRGHMTPEEALAMADQAAAERVVLVHFRAELRDRIERACAARPGATAGYPGLRIDVVGRQAASTTSPAQVAQQPPGKRTDGDGAALGDGMVGDRTSGDATLGEGAGADVAPGRAPSSTAPSPLN
jgi:ribonuclease BN (tRNA processing enzyme)